MNKLKAGEENAEDGRMFAYVYTGNTDTFELQRKAYNLFCGTVYLTIHFDLILLISVFDFELDSG